MTTSRAIRTPGSCHPRRQVVVLGAGIAGLTAAHELVERGFEVTVYEPRRDERSKLGAPAPGTIPPVKLGGLAASQYSTLDPDAGGSRARLRPFPGRRGNPHPPPHAVAGEHGFRFFPAYYLHLWDLLQRIPVYEQVAGRGVDEVAWAPTSRTVMDNVRRVVAQATTVDGKPSLVFPRELPGTLAELLTITNQLTELGIASSDVSTFTGRLLRYLVTSPLRRGSELANISAYDFFTGRGPGTGPSFSYSPRFDALIRDMPKVLAAFDSHWGDARTNLTTFLQLQLQMDRHDNKADGVLNGPTTEAWFDHWYRHLVELGVHFISGAAVRIEPPPIEPRRQPHERPGVRVVLADGTRLTPDYVVVAVDAPAAEHLTAALRDAGTGGAVAALDGFTTTAAPLDGPLQPADTRPARRRDPFAMHEMGRLPWDRFQTLAGIQYYFDTEFQLVRGHIYYSGTEWGLSSINQHGLWERRPVQARDGYVAVLSVDISDFNTPSRHLLDGRGRGKAARECTADELAVEVWRQIVTAMTGQLDNVPEALFPVPAWYTLDRNLVLADSPAGRGDGTPVRNEAPYLVPIVGDWSNRPDGEPWNPAGSSWITRPTEAQWLEDLHQGHVWQARHGGYQIHHNSLVLAGTWTRTFTRITSMEAACESARHAVNAILDHYIWVETGGADRRENVTLNWRIPFGFLDQGFSSPIRLPSPAGDYCFVFDIDNREPLETRGLRDLDDRYQEAALPHPLDALALPGFGAPAPAVPSPSGGPHMTTPSNDYTGNLLAYLQAWRQYLEQVTKTMPPTSPVLPMPPAPLLAPSGQPLIAPPGLVAPWPTTAPPSGGSVPPVAPPPPPRSYPDQSTDGTFEAGARSGPLADLSALHAADLAEPPSELVAGCSAASAFRSAGQWSASDVAAPAAQESLYSSSMPESVPSPAQPPVQRVERVRPVNPLPKVEHVRPVNVLPVDGRVRPVNPLPIGELVRPVNPLNK